MSSSATAVYSVLSDDHAAAADNNDPGPGPLLSSIECASGGDAIHTVAILTPLTPLADFQSLLIVTIVFNTATRRGRSDALPGADTLRG